MTRRRIEFFYDLCSPYSYLAFWRLPGIAKRASAAVIPRPVSLPGLLALVGNPSPTDVEAKRNYIRSDLKALSLYYGIPLEWPEPAPPDTSVAMAGLALLTGNAQVELAQRLFEAIWLQGLNLADETVLDALMGESLLADAASENAREQLESNTLEAVERGAFGVPSCFVGDQLFFGNERLFLLQRYLND